MKADSALVIFSGGLDSTVCLHWALRKFRKVEAISFDYAQTNQIELSCAKKIAKKLGVKHSVIPLQFFGRLCPNAVTYKGFHFSSDKGFDGRPSTYMPGRNSLFLSVGVAYGVPRDIHDYVIGTSEVDGTLKPDCRADFMDSFGKTASVGVDARLSIHRPLETFTKGEVFALADEMKCLESVIQHTHTCFRGMRRTLHSWGYGCGTCTSCELRIWGYRQFENQSKRRGAFSRVKSYLKTPLSREIENKSAEVIVSVGHILEKRLGGALPGKITDEVCDALRIWAATIEQGGRQVINQIPLYRDRAAGRNRRAVRILPGYFLIYEVISAREIVAINVVEESEWKTGKN